MACRMGIEALSTPSLPSDLDEAAMAFAKTTFTRPLSDTPEQEITIIEPDKLVGFKAGAAWMAGQGETIEDVVYACQDADMTPLVEVCPKTFKLGDKVIVQIRKK